MWRRLKQLDAGVGTIASRRFRELIEKSADQMAQGMTTKSVAAEQNDIDREHDRADADAERVLPVAGSVNHSAFQTS